MPCFPFNCVRRNPHASTKTAASVGAAPGRVKAAGRASRGPSGAGRRAVRAPSLCYRMRASGARCRARGGG
ncbi:hypothetical protein Bpla01_33460 [Burkholderia plantarii]|nr:hypothetical protein Bpla01_33460 [Burkholderia plantarii]